MHFRIPQLFRFVCGAWVVGLIFIYLWKLYELNFGIKYGSISYYILLPFDIFPVFLAIVLGTGNVHSGGSSFGYWLAEAIQWSFLGWLVYVLTKLRAKRTQLVERVSG